MSVKVNLDQLADTLADFTFAYLITVGDDYRAHTVAVEPVFTDGVLDVGRVGNRTSGNLAGHPDVTLAWPPSQPDGYTLIVDGLGHVVDGSANVTPNRAVLHRKATPDSPATDPAGLHDCLPLGTGRSDS